MAITASEKSNLLGVTSFMFNFAPDNASFARMEAILEANGNSFYNLGTQLANTSTFTSQFEGLETTSEKIGLILGRLGLEEGSLGYTRGEAFITQKLEQGTPVGQVLMEIGEIMLRDPEDVPEGLEGAAATLQNKITVANSYLESGLEGYSNDTLPGLLEGVDETQASVDSAQSAIDSAEPGTPGDTFSLTADVDARTGTADDDTFDGSLTVGSTPSFTNIDSIDGGAGTDTLNATFVGGANGNATDFAGPAPATVLADSVENVEVFNFRSLDGTTDVDFAGYQGAEQIWSDRSSQNLAVTNVANAVTVGMVAGSESTFSVTYANALDATATQNIALDDANGTIDLTNADVQNFAISNTGDSELAELTNLGDANIQNLTITGDGTLELNVTNNITAGVIDASGATADIDLTVGVAVTANQADGTDRDVTLGAGDDVVNVAAAGLAEVDSVDGGEGNDTLVVDGSSATVAQDVLDKSSNFEVLQLNGFNLANANAISASILNNVGYDEYVFQDANGGELKNISADNTIGLVNTDDGDTGNAGTADTITLNLANGVTDLNVSSENTDTTANSDVLQITTNAASVSVDFVANAQSTGTTLNLFETTAADDELSSVTITGEEDVTFDATVATALDDLESVDASALVGDAVITVGEGVTVTTGAGDDGITADGGSTVTGGAGDDTFTIANASDALGDFVTIEDFQAGDTIDFGTGVDVAAVAEITEASLGLAPGDEATFEDFANAAGNAGTAQTVSHFEFDGDTYLYNNGLTASEDFNAGEDVIVKLEGSVDLSDLAGINGDTAGTVEIA